MNVTDKDVDDVYVIFQQVRTHAGLGAFLFLVPVLQISHGRRLGSLIAKDRVNQRMHDVLNQAINAANFATMKGASSGLTRNTTRTSNCIVSRSFEITSNGLKVLTTSPEVHSTVGS